MSAAPRHPALSRMTSPRTRSRHGNAAGSITAAVPVSSTITATSATRRHATALMCSLRRWFRWITASLKRPPSAPPITASRMKANTSNTVWRLQKGPRVWRNLLNESSGWWIVNVTQYAHRHARKVISTWRIVKNEPASSTTNMTPASGARSTAQIPHAAPVARKSRVSLACALNT